MRRGLLVSLFVAGTFAGTAAQAQNATCQALGESVELQEKQLSLLNAEGIGENSAARASARSTDQLVAVNLIQANLTLMAANKCAMPKAPITTSAYTLDAIKCATDLLSARTSAGRAPLPSCDFSAWSRRK